MIILFVRIFKHWSFIICHCQNKKTITVSGPQFCYFLLTLSLYSYILILVNIISTSRLTYIIYFRTSSSIFSRPCLQKNKWWCNPQSVWIPPTCSDTQPPHITLSIHHFEAGIWRCSVAGRQNWFTCGPLVHCGEPWPLPLGIRRVGALPIRYVQSAWLTDDRADFWRGRKILYSHPAAMMHSQVSGCHSPFLSSHILSGRLAATSNQTVDQSGVQENS